MVLITGATGHVGRRVADLLAPLGVPLRLMARRLELIPKVSGCERIAADYSDPKSLDKAFDQAERAFIVSGYGEPGKRAELHRNAFLAAQRAGVKHVVYLSCLRASPSSQFPMSRDHYQSEGYLKETTTPHTILRDSLYLDMIPKMFDKEGIMRGPGGTGAVSWVAREDVAQAVASILNQNQLKGTFDITGPALITLRAVASELTALVGRELRYEEESMEEGRRWRNTLGAAPWEVETWLGSYAAISTGEFNDLSNDVERITGKRPLRLREYFSTRPELLQQLTTSR
jgi:NAD(P)H dehydrogenase (quinone)